ESARDRTIPRGGDRARAGRRRGGEETRTTAPRREARARRQPESPESPESPEWPEWPESPSQSLHAFRHLVELRVAVGLVVSGVEKRTGIARRRRDDRARRHHPQADRLAAARVHVARILHRLLGIRRVHAARMRVRRPLRILREYFPHGPF